MAVFTNKFQLKQYGPACQVEERVLSLIHYFNCYPLVTVKSQIYNSIIKIEADKENLVFSELKTMNDFLFLDVKIRQHIFLNTKNLELPRYFEKWLKYLDIPLEMNEIQEFSVTNNLKKQLPMKEIVGQPL